VYTVTLTVTDNEGLTGFSSSTIKVNVVTVLLTLDDGPEGDEYGFNSTSSVLNTLSNNDVQAGIKATFFTLTHGKHWGGTELGESLLIQERNEGHVASIHAGGKGCIGPHFWFARHTWRVRTKPYPVGPNGEILKKGTTVGNSGLESDLVAAIRRLRYLYENPYYNPEFVRPPGYFYNSAVLEAYSSEAVKNELGNIDGLKMILTDTLWGDGGGGPWPPPSIVSAGLKASIKNCIEKGIHEIVLTLHDSNDTTAQNLETYLNDIRQAAEEEGYNVKFVDSESEAREILNRRWTSGNWQGK
jgi:peptidoglycan/xylan/chitin deacetylase (PgdA/CDA1 family)